MTRSQAEGGHKMTVSAGKMNIQIERPCPDLPRFGITVGIERAGGGDEMLLPQELPRNPQRKQYTPTWDFRVTSLLIHHRYLADRIRSDYLRSHSIVG